MKKTFFLMLIFIASCSQNKSPNASNLSSNADEDVIQIAPLTVTTPGTGIIPVTEMDFGVLAQSAKSTQDLIIHNNSSSLSVTYTAQDFDSSLIAPFSIVSNGCIKTVSPRGKCSIKFELKNLSLESTEQDLTSLFVVRGINVSLVGTLQPAPIAPVEPIASISITPSDINFGTVNVGSFVEKTVIIKNNGTASTTLNISAPSSLSITASSTCGVSLATRSSCSVKYKYSSTITEQVVSQNLASVANNSITYSVSSIAPSVEEPSILNIVPQANSVDYSLTQPSVQSGTIRFTNTGTIALVAPVSAVSSNPGVQITSVSCVGGLNRSKTCDVNYTVSGPSGASVQTIKVQSGTKASSNFSLNLNIVPSEVACSLADAQSNGVSILNSNSSFAGNKVGSDVSQCLLASNACNQYYSLAIDSKSCQAVSSACLPADASSNGWNISQASAYSGNRVGTDISTCSVSDCNESFILNTQTKTCSVPSFEATYSATYSTCSAISSCDGEGSQSAPIIGCNRLLDGIQDSSVAIEYCSGLPQSSSQTCLSPAGNKIVTIDNGTKTVSCLEGSTIQNFVSLSCSGQAVANNTLQTCELPPEASAAGLLIGGFSSQTYITGLSPLMGFSNPQNVTSALFYSGSTCSGSPLTANLIFGTLYQVTIPAGEGSRSFSSRVFGGLGAGNCVTSSVIVDTVLPTLSASLASATTSSAAQAPNALLSFTDAGSGISSVVYSVSKLPYDEFSSDWNNSPAALGQRSLPLNTTQYQATYDSSFDETHGTVGLLSRLLPYNTPLYVIIQIMDNAGNTRYQSLPFTSTENLEFTFKFAESLPSATGNDVVTYYLNKAFLNQYYFSSAFGIEETGDASFQSKRYIADSYYTYSLPLDELACGSDGGVWNSTFNYCDFAKDVCLEKGLIYASRGDGAAPSSEQGHCGVNQLKVGFDLANMSTVSGNASYNSVLASFVFFRDECLVTDGILGCNFPPPAPPEATEGYLIFASTSGIRRSTYDKATNTIVGASTITLNTFFNNVASSSIGYSNGNVYIGSNLAGNSTRLQRVPIDGGAMTVVKDYPTNFSNASIHDLINCNNKLYYRAPISAASSIFGLYMFDTTQPISGSNPSTTVITNNVNKISCVANKLYYIGPQDSNTRGIFVIDTATNVKTFITTGRTGSLVGNTLDQYEQLVFGKDHFYYLPTINDSLTLNVKKVRLSDNVLVQTINTTTVGGIQGQYFYLSIGVDKSNDDLYLAEADLGVSTTRIKKYNGVSNSYVGSAISGVLADTQPEIMVSADYITWRHGGGGSTVSNLTKNGATVTNNSSSKVRRYRMYDGYYFMNLAGSSSSSNFDNTVRGASANTMSSLISNLGDFDIVDKP